MSAEKLRAAAEAALSWFEAEADHPRQDPIPAYRIQAKVLREALVPTAVDRPGVDVVPVLRIVFRRGLGADDDPIRLVVAYYTQSGVFLFEQDPMP